MEPTLRKRLAVVIWLLPAASAFPQVEGPRSPNSGAGGDSLATAQAAVSQARQQLEEDTSTLAVDQKTSRSACKKQGPDCDAAKAKVSADRQTVKKDKATLKQAWARQVALLHASFKGSLQGQGSSSRSGGGRGGGGTNGGGSGTGGQGSSVGSSGRRHHRNYGGGQGPASP
jgi:hypothetical protein